MNTWPWENEVINDMYSDGNYYGPYSLTTIVFSDLTYQQLTNVEV